MAVSRGIHGFLVYKFSDFRSFWSNLSFTDRLTAGELTALQVQRKEEGKVLPKKRVGYPSASHTQNAGGGAAAPLVI